MLAAKLASQGIPEEITITTKIESNKQTNLVENRFDSYKGKGKIDVDVAFMGVWDTVGAFGIPVRLFGIPFNRINLFKDMHVAANVKRAVHLVCVDDTRNAFEPTLMNYKPGVVHEVWFPGVHSDVGGGYLRDALGWITINYMISQLQACLENYDLGPLDYNSKILEEYRESGSKSEKYYFHFHGLGYKKTLRDIHVLNENKPASLTHYKPRIHHSVFELEKNKNTCNVVVRKRWFRSDQEKIFRIQYNPANIKRLNKNYEIIRNGSNLI
jgi:hypothetical protein